MNKVSEIDWARLAAYIDGEGTISIVRTYKKKYINFSLYIQVTNTDTRLLVWLKDNFGGHLSTHGRIPAPNQKPAFVWKEGSGYLVYKLITHFRKFLIIKGEQADVAIKFWEQSGRWTRRMIHGRPDWMKQKQESFFLEMKGLNKRGMETDEVVTSSATKNNLTDNGEVIKKQ